jgi:energy-coupling factor transporter ATP-binding protein EcfA2
MMRQRLAAAREAEVDARTRHLALQEQAASLKAEIDQAEQGWLIEAEVTEAFRDEALWKSLSDGVEVFLSEARNSIIRPLVDELSRQWKTFRPDAPWTLDVDDEGHLCMVYEGTSLPFSSLSGGEKAAALVLLRVALTRALTDADFMLLDEPLEHMDPRSRRLLVSSLHQVVRKGMFSQILLTTYEEQLARRFVESGWAHALYLD